MALRHQLRRSPFESIPSVPYLGSLFKKLWFGSTLAGRVVLLTVGGALFVVWALAWVVLDCLLYACNKPG